MQFQVIEHDSPAYKESVQLRDRILRQPLGLEFTPEQLAAENDALHIAGYLGETIRACCVLVNHGPRGCQVRQVAVDQGLQRLGYGNKLMLFAEQQARLLGSKVLFCHSREEARAFYERLGYTTVGEPFIEVGITHIQMEKSV